MQLSDYLALLALVFSVISGVLALRNSHDNTRYTAYDRATDLFLEIDRAFLNCPEIRVHFYDNVAVTDDPVLRGKVHAQAELMLDAFDWILRRRRRVSKFDMGGWQAYMLDSLASSQVLLEYHHSRPHWHPYVDSLLRERGLGCNVRRRRNHRRLNGGQSVPVPNPTSGDDQEN